MAKRKRRNWAVNLAEFHRAKYPPEDVRRQSEHWSLEDGLSPSAIWSFVLDREQFRLGFVEGWRDDTAYTFHKEWGSAWHALHADWIRGKIRNLGKWLVAWDKKVARRIDMTPTVRRQQDIGYGLIRVMWPVYAEMYRADRERIRS